MYTEAPSHLFREMNACIFFILFSLSFTLSFFVSLEKASSTGGQMGKIQQNRNLQLKESAQHQNCARKITLGRGMQTSLLGWYVGVVEHLSGPLRQYGGYKMHSIHEMTTNQVFRRGISNRSSVASFVFIALPTVGPLQWKFPSTAATQERQTPA